MSELSRSLVDAAAEAVEPLVRDRQFGLPPSPHVVAVVAVAAVLETLAAEWCPKEYQASLHRLAAEVGVDR